MYYLSKADQQKRFFKDISSRNWEHPADRAALAALRKVPGLDFVLRKFIGTTTEKSLRLLTLASSIKVSSKQFPKIYELHKEACFVLDSDYIPEIYVSESPFLNAGAIGVDKPFIVLNSSLVETLSEEELLGVIGHELGHCLSGHALYKTLLAFLMRFSLIALNIPLGMVALMGIIYALKEWDRKSELSADRAGLLVSQNPKGEYSTLMKMAGGRNAGQMDVDEFFKQAQEYEGAGNVLDSVYKLLNLAVVHHPFPVTRALELKAWVDSGEYDKILSGDYYTRDEDSEESIYDNFKNAAKQYRDDIDQSNDPLVTMLSSLFNEVESLAEKTADGVDTLFEKAENALDSFWSDDKKKD
ncbi:MAG: Zn-dependent protease with chaperone function [bacterium]|jgi:Zn-dependent protease with chaperone function